MMRDSFAELHPLNNLLYFAFVIGFSLALRHPLAQGISLICAAAYCVSIDGKGSVRFLLKWCLPMVLLTAFINPAFNHAGTTILTYLGNGNPLTLESILYGLSAGALLATMLLWFSSFNRIMTSDKFIYLFGRLIPAMSLVLSMSLRFVPRFKNQLAAVTEAQRSIGRDVSAGSLWQRARVAVRILSILITWALENAIETADSMKSRGYGLRGRTAFSLYQFDKRDADLLRLFLFCGLLLLGGIRTGAFGFRYFPNIRSAALDGATLPFYAVYTAFCMIPILFNIREERRWNASISRE